MTPPPLPPVWPPAEAAGPPIAAAPPPPDPAWSGLELALLVAFTGMAVVLGTAFAGLIWAIGRTAAGAGMQPGTHALVALSLVGQTVGLAAGFGLAWLWLANQRGVRFWPAIHWRKLRAGQVAGALAGGVAMTLAVQGLGRILPMPSTTPMDRLFTPQTIWLMVVYGVGLAPFFEEFFFRGLLYPTLKSTFECGLTREELRRWHWPVRAGAVLVAMGLAFWYERLRLLQLGTPAAVRGLEIAGAAAVAALAFPGLITAPAGWALNRMQGWRQAEAFAIGITGLLFGLLHAAQLGWAWAAVLILVLVGVVLTAVRAATGSLMASWLMHCAYNGILFVAQYFATQGFRHFPPGLR